MDRILEYKCNECGYVLIEKAMDGLRCPECNGCLSPVKERTLNDYHNKRNKSMHNPKGIKINIKLEGLDRINTLLKEISAAIDKYNDEDKVYLTIDGKRISSIAVDEFMEYGR